MPRADGFAPNTHVCTWGAVAGLPIHAQMVAIGTLCLVVACGCVGQVLRVACARVRAYLYVRVRACVFGVRAGCVLGGTGARRRVYDVRAGVCYVLCSLRV